MIPAFQYRWAAPLLDRYNLRLLKGAFASIRVAGLEHLSAAGALVATPNHSCWWDGCVDLFLSRQVLRRRSLLLMGETELRKHRIFSSLGVFSGPPRYAAGLLDSASMLWIYPQGEMLPSRAPLRLRDGALVIASIAGARIVPVAQRYEFLSDDHPDVLVRVGEPFVATGRRDHQTMLTAMQTLLDQVDEDLNLGRLTGYKTVLHGKESRNRRLERLRGSQSDAAN